MDDDFLRYDLEKACSLLGALKFLWLNPKAEAVALYRLSTRVGPRLGMLVHKINLQRNGVDISPRATIGRGLKIAHPIGIVVGKGAKIGGNCTLFQNVTIGGKEGENGDDVMAYPVIGDGVTIFSHAQVIGKVHVGDGAVVGAGSLVLHDVAEGATVVGSPARPLAC